jgi:ABC-type dipeptide/oligopeptide/nickel transport system permease component/ABC-type transport system substrate-binding protein
MKLSTRTLLRTASRFAGVCALLAALTVGLAWLARPDLERQATFDYTPSELAAVEALRDTSIDPETPVVIHRDVNYAEGEGGAWYPKAEAPILRELVEEGKLPPVAERVGPEPCVLAGVDGIGRYGGTWFRAALSLNDVGIVRSRLAYPALVRWSPTGYPIVPHVARSYEVSADSRQFTFELRRGMRWSDGHPFTADDILYWWEREMQCTKITGAPPEIMRVQGKTGRVERLGPHTVRFSFPHPKGVFLAQMATYDGVPICDSPKHYLERFHPLTGDKALCEDMMERLGIADRRGLYYDRRQWHNPEHPRLWPWVYRMYKANPPQTFVRNPYYFAVDPKGNQLPYVDRLLFNQRAREMVAMTAGGGQVSMQARHILYDDYSYVMDQRKSGGYEVYHWYAGDRSAFAIQPNLNRRIDPEEPATANKHALLNEARFRRALSVAIDRQAIIDAEYGGQLEPATCSPGPASYFHNPRLYKEGVEHDPDKANRLLDQIGLTQRDYEGYRTFRDGTRMTFFLDVSNFTGEGPSQFVIRDWGRVGVRAILRARNRTLFRVEQYALEHDFDAWGGNGEFMPLIQPRYFVPVNESFFALGYAAWYRRGGLYGNPLARTSPRCIEPPPDHPVRRAMVLYDRATQKSGRAAQKAVFDEVLEIAADNLWTLNICTPPPVLMLVKNGFRNVPRTAVYSWDFQSPGNAGFETYFFEDATDSPGAVAQMKRAILEPTLPKAAQAPGQAAGGNRWLGNLLRYGFAGTLGLFLLMAAVKHPFVGRRLLLMIPTLLVISVVSFTIIQLPPGDYVESRIMELRLNGDEADIEQIRALEERFHLKDPMHSRYLRWMGLYWFRSFAPADKGLLQGHLGWSMQTSRPVNEVVGDRVLQTILISLGTILFTWTLAIPIGIYSAVRQYSVGDYLLTFVGFIGMCVPSFLLTLLLCFAAKTWFGITVEGLFSAEYGAQPEWDWPKALDLMKHIWVPIVVLGVAGTAGMIRVMRGNLLDELKKPYVTTARAKGVRPMTLLFKYPVRLALNPFISGIGGLFPMLISGGAIVAMVLSLPTVGPLMLEALLNEDMYLAGSMLMVLSILGIVGTLVSDLLLLWLDPRIRFGGGSR